MILIGAVTALATSAGAQQAAKTAAEVYRAAKGAVVTVRTSKAAGTGFVIDSGPLVVTAYHVIQDDPYGATVDQSPGAVRLVGYDEATDVALLEVSHPLPGRLALRTGPSPETGTRVYAIGTPLGFLDSTMSEGIVSGMRRVGDLALMQITAPISHGSSGGPVLDEQGRVVGLVKAIIEDGQGLNFAVSAYNVRLAVDRIKRGDSIGTYNRGRPAGDDGSAAGLFDNLGKRSKNVNNPFDRYFNDTGKHSHTAANPFDAETAHLVPRKVVLSGAAALYWVYRVGNSEAAAKKAGRSVYYLSRIGRVYYRDLNHVAHWIAVPTSPLLVPVASARVCKGLQGYGGAVAGETDLARFEAHRRR